MAHQKLAGKRKVVLEQLAGNVFRVTDGSGVNHFIVGEMKKVGYVTETGVFVEPDENGVWPRVFLFKAKDGQITTTMAPGGSDYF